MKILRSLYLWTTGLLYFGAVVVITIILTYLLPQKKLDPALKAMLRFIFRLMRSPVTVTGAHHIQENTTYLFMSNHVSFFDVPLLAGYIPVFIRAVEAREHFSWPFYGWVLRRLGNIPLDRKSIHGSRKTLDRVASMLKNGTSMVIMPEGHRTLDGRLREFKTMPFMLAREAGVPILPVGISGLYTLKPKRSWYVHPTPIHIRFGEPVPAETVRRKDARMLRDMVREKIRSLVTCP